MYITIITSSHHPMVDYFSTPAHSQIFNSTSNVNFGYDNDQ